MYSMTQHIPLLVGPWECRMHFKKWCGTANPNCMRYFLCVLASPSALDGVVMEEAISAAPVLEADEGGILVKVQSQKDSEMYRIAKVCKVLKWTHMYTRTYTGLYCGGVAWWCGKDVGL